MRSYSEEELKLFEPNDEILDRLFEARARGDEAAETRCFQQLIFPADALLAVKETRGADWVRRQGIRTDDADRVFGPGWLDRDVG